MQAKTKPVRAAIYTRISHDPQGGRLGVRRQEEDCRAYVEQRGWELAGTYEDDDLSAFSGKARPAYRRLVEDIEARRIEAVVAWHPDRLHRHPLELEEFIELLERAGVHVETVRAGAIDLSSPTGRAVARTLGAWARYESEHKSERLRRKHLELAMAGKDAGGGRPFGYEEDRTTARRSEAAFICEAADRILLGESLRSVCRDWTERDIRTAKGRYWQPVTLRNILVSARISGRREHFQLDGSRTRIGRITSIATWPGIIDVEKSDRLRALLGDPGRRQNGVTLTSAKHLLAGIAKCSLCGGSMLTRYYARSGERGLGCVRIQGTERCGKTFILAEPTEQLVSEALLRRVEGGVLASTLAKSDDRQLTDELLAVESSLASLAEDWAADRISRAEWSAARPVLAERHKLLTRRVQVHHRTQFMDDIPDPLRDAWSNLPLHRRRAILTVLVEAVVIRPGVRGLNRFDPRRIEVCWKA
ncbi:recombinase family protein [Candidatus Nephthysia bennettiae]|uniref:Recombinase family protein n=1 Tax=Candidatus Nephthysia bennettiae TaxID=3127016 RepID=A0A934N7K4_9BACT|nr:recombinase family protein [Candidatus Dormibacteraeota bacterium]MBJ7614280.1 recombinase family protein [Candidatus Dormibacteraeota bacterium]